MGLVSGIKGVFSKKNQETIMINQPAVGNFDVNNQYNVNPYQENMQMMQPQMMQQPIYVQQPQQPAQTGFEIADYQRKLIEQNKTAHTFTPRPKLFENSYEKQYRETPQYRKTATGINEPIPNYSAYDRAERTGEVLSQSVPSHQREEQYQRSYSRQKPMNYNYGPDVYHQETLDFNAMNPIEYGNYQQMYNQPAQRMEYYDDYYEMPKNNMANIPNQFSNANQFRNAPQYSNIDNEYQVRNNYNLAPSNSYQPSVNQSYKERMASVSHIPSQIAKEIRSEKLRVFIMFLVGSAGIIFMSIMIAAYYQIQQNLNNASFQFAGFTRDTVLYPFFSIFFLLIAIAFFGISVTDYSLLFSNVKKYERELIIGNETVPYFITRNYRSIISRSVYITWISFSIYICGAISLGVLYGLQGQYEKAIEQGGDTSIKFLWWTMGYLKSFKAEITTNIIVLISTLGCHIANIIWGRSRKNNVISYYGFEVIPVQETKEIKKNANKVCLIIFFVCLAIILFAIVIPWLIIRKRQGKALSPWSRA